MKALGTVSYAISDSLYTVCRLCGLRDQRVRHDTRGTRCGVSCILCTAQGSQRILRAKS